jgi:DNA mismatch repair protein MutL
MPIKILPPDIANKIAAGEVVERPASVVKELIENAIDAESTSISVEIRAGGKRLIRVSDNGTGMPREDALIALERHATSKVGTIEDLQRIQTFGFRGEALPSIASVSQLELLTRTADGLVGTKISVDGGVAKSVQESGCSPGTHFTINNLFYNVPARLKFLKSETTELNHLTNQVTWAALAHPKIQFSHSHDRRSLIDVRSCDSYIERIRLLYGKEFAENLIEFDAELPNLRLHSFIGKPDLTKANRSYQLFFLNSRPIRSKILGAALGEAMRSMVPKNRFAVAFLFLTMDAQEVDVNVHPAKVEVRFRNERAIYSAISRMIHSGIHKHKYIPKFDKATQPVSSTDSQVEKRDDVKPRIASHAAESEMAIATSTVFSPTPPWQAGQTAGKAVESLPSSAPAGVQPPERSIPEGTPLELFDFEDVQLKTNLFNTYIVAEGKDRVFIIDQHVAAERVLYEHFVQQLKSDGIPVQGLLLPVTVEATPQQITTLHAHTALFEKLGFELEQFGGNTILVRSIPTMLSTSSVAMTVTDLLDRLPQTVSPSDELLDVQDEALIMLACKSAVKAGDSLTMNEMVALVKDLSQAKLPFNCPHSRPIVVEMGKNELESRFKRR